MIDLEEYIRNNREAFDDQEPPKGHLERFEARLDAAGLSERTPKRQISGVRRAKRLAWIASVAAAVVAAVIFINRSTTEVDWFAGVADDPVSVYLSYSEKAGEMYREIFIKDVEGNLGTAAGSVAEEAVPMIDQLPEELDDARKAAIMKEYYGKLLDGLNKINKIKEL